MPNILKKLDGVINNIFSIGLKNNQTTLISTNSGLNVDNNIDVGNNKVKSAAAPSDGSDLVNLSYVQQQFGDCSHIYYTNITNTISIPYNIHRIGNISNEDYIIKNIVLDVSLAYDSNAEISVTLTDGNNTYNILSNSSVDLSTIGQYYFPSFQLIKMNGSSSLNIVVNNATTFGQAKLYIEYVNI